MKARGQLIINEFAELRSVSDRSGLKLHPDYEQKRSLFRKRNLLFKKVRLNPKNEHHAAFLCSIVYDHLYGNKRMIGVTKFGDNADFDLLVRFLRFRQSSRLRGRSDLYRNFITRDLAAAMQYGAGASLDSFRMRLDRAAKKLIAGKAVITKKRQDRLATIVPDILAIYGKSAKS